MADGEMMAKAAFHAMTEGTEADWQAIGAAARPFNAAHADRLIQALKDLGHDQGGIRRGPAGALPSDRHPGHARRTG